MAKKIEINENWEPVEVEDLDNLFVVIFKQGSFDNGYVEAFDTDDILMQSAYDNLAKQYDDCGCDECTKIYLIKLPNTEQVQDMCNTGLFNGSSCDPHVIEATRDLFNRADCEHLSCWSGCGLTEDKKKKKVCSSSYCGFTDPALNIAHFNKCMGTGGLQNPNAPHLVVGDTLPNGPVADAGNSSSAGASDAGSSSGEGMGESLTEAKEELVDITDLIKELKEPEDYWERHAEMRKDGHIFVRKSVADDLRAWGIKKGKITEDIEKELKIQDNENIEKDIEELDPPIEPEYFPNNMGINLSSVKSEKWVQQDDGQLKTITVEFDPATEEEKEEQGLTEAHLDYSTQLAKMRALEAGTRGFNAGSASLEKILFNYDICISHNLPKARKAMEDALRLHGWDKYIKPTKKQIDISKFANIFDPGYINSAAVSTVCHGKADPQSLINYYGPNISDILTVLVIALLMGEKSLADATKDYIIKYFTVTLQELKDFLNKGFTNTASVVEIKKLIKACNESLTEDAHYVTSYKSLDEAQIYSHKLMQNFEVPNKINVLDQNKVEDFIKQLSPAEIFRVGYVTPMRFYSELNDKFDLVKATEMEGYTGMDYRDANVDAVDNDARVANAQRQINTYTNGAQGHKLNPHGEKFSTDYRVTNKLALNPEKINQQIEYEYEVDENGNIKLDNKGQPIVKKDDKGQKVIKTAIDMNKILFYPRVGSQPIVHYYLDLHDGKGFRPVKRDVLVNTLYKKIVETEDGETATLSEVDKKWLIKDGYGKDLNTAFAKFKEIHGNIPVCIFRKAKSLGVNPQQYWKEHPYSPRWSLADFIKKANHWVDEDNATIMAQDAETISGKELDQRTGMSPHVALKDDPDAYLDKSENKPQVRALYSNQVYYLSGNPGTLGSKLAESLEEDIEDQVTLNLDEEVKLDEAKRYVKRYYVRPQNIFCSNKEDILKALLRVEGENCSIYSLKDLPDHDDVQDLKPSDIIYYYDDGILYDKNHVKVMDYDLNVKHEEERKKFADVNTAPTAQVNDVYDDRLTDADLQDKETVANFRAINARQMK